MTLVEALQPGQRYYGLIDSGVRGITYFKPEQLRTDSILYGGRLQSVEAFEKNARSGGKCATGVSNEDVVVGSVGLLAVTGVAAGLFFVVQRRRRS